MLHLIRLLVQPRSDVRCCIFIESGILFLLVPLWWHRLWCLSNFWYPVGHQSSWGKVCSVCMVWNTTSGGNSSLHLQMNSAMEKRIHHLPQPCAASAAGNPGESSFDMSTFRNHVVYLNYPTKIKQLLAVTYMVFCVSVTLCLVASYGRVSWLWKTLASYGSSVSHRIRLYWWGGKNEGVCY